MSAATYSNPADWPWTHFASPAAHWDVLPSFVLGQALFIGLAVLALVHAHRSGRDHVMIWFAALVAGTANDFVFMALPLVDNFWQAQGVVMLTARMPLYIPCVYVCFMYFPTVAVRRLGLGRWQTIALTGLAACLFYAPYDIVGAKFLWWTWHDTDQPIAARILGAPCSSSLWVLTFVGAFAGLVDHTLRGRTSAGADPLSARIISIGLLKVAGLTTLVMMLQMTVLQQIDGGCPAKGAFFGGIAVYAAVLLRSALGRSAMSPRVPSAMDRRLMLGAVAYFATLLTIGAVFDPSQHVSAGVHQEVGECYVEATDITGFTRHQYLCANDFEESFDLSCVDAAPAEGSTWYTVCGREHDAFGAWFGGLAVLCVSGAATFFFLLYGWRRRAAAVP